MLKKQFRHGIHLLFYKPSAFWTSVAGADRRSSAVNGTVFFLVLLVISVATGISGRFIYALSHPVPVDYIPEAVSNMFTPVVTLLILSVITHLIFKRFGKKDFIESYILCVYSLLPYLLVSAVILLVRDLYFFGLIGLYSLYVYAQGLGSYRSVIKEKIVGRTVIVLMVILVTHFFTDLLFRYFTLKFLIDA